MGSWIIWEDWLLGWRWPRRRRPPPPTPPPSSRCPSLPWSHPCKSSHHPQHCWWSLESRKTNYTESSFSIMVRLDQNFKHNSLLSGKLYTQLFVALLVPSFILLWIWINSDWFHHSKVSNYSSTHLKLCLKDICLMKKHIHLSHHTGGG